MESLIYRYLLIIIVLIIAFLYVWIKKKNSLIKIIILIALLMSIILPPTWLAMKLNPIDVSVDSMVNTFTKNQESFHKVAQYMIAYGEDTLIVQNDNLIKIGYFSDEDDSQASDISDEKVKNEIKYILNKLKYESIYYSGGHVTFVRTSNNSARNQNIIYVVNRYKFNEQDEEVILIGDGWYYLKGH
jgi:hypothetical protein